MRFNSMQRYYFSANYSDFTVSTDNNGQNYDYFPAGTIQFTGGIGGGGGRMTIYTAEPLRVKARLDYIVNYRGEMVMPWEVQPQGVVYEIGTCSPVLNVFGDVEMYRSSLTVV